MCLCGVRLPPTPRNDDARPTKHISSDCHVHHAITMITPHFELSQTTTHVTVEIRVPHVRVSIESVEIVVETSTLHFSSPPYLLVLTFPAALVDNTEGECATYDPCKNGGTIFISLVKQEPAAWPDLDLMGALMAPRIKTTRQGAIEILDESVHAEEEQECETQQDDSILSDILNVLRPHYGFLNMHSGIFSDLARDGLAAEMLALPNPDSTSAGDRRRLRLEMEMEDFDCNRYLGDLDVQDDYIYQTAMDLRPHWHQERDQSSDDAVENLAEKLSDLTTANDDKNNITLTKSFFSPKESAQLASIPYPILPTNISPEQDESLLLGLIDILFAYVYDHIMTDGEPTIESSWTVCILSSTLSWLDDFHGDSLERVMRHAIRRALIYPYLRNYELALYCWNQVCSILKEGRRCIIRCLLQVRTILEKSECHYLGNRLHVDPYLAWIQRHVTDSQVFSLCKRLEALLSEIEQGNAIQKESLGLNLVELERQLGEEEEDSSEIDSDDESSEEEESSPDDDSTCSSRVADEILPCDDEKPATIKLLDDEIGDWSASVGEMLENLKLQEDTKATEPTKLIEDL